jgi:hypothetical protein
MQVLETGVVSNRIKVCLSFSCVSAVAAFIVPKEAVYTSNPAIEKSNILKLLADTKIELNIK